MTILITSDLHWNDKPRDHYRHSYVEEIIKEADHVETVLILGDLTDQKDNHGAWLVNKIFSHISRIAERCRVYILKGNHDFTIPSCPFFACLGKLQHVTWVSTPMWDRIGGMKVLFLPHTTNYEKDWASTNIRDYPVVFTHNTFAGAKSESGEELDGIPWKVFSKKQIVVSGDVHVPQKLGPVEYVGPPYGIRFGDDYDPHMMLLDSSGKKTYIPYDGPRKLVMNLPLGAPFEVEGLRDGDIFKVQVELDPGNFGRFQEYKELVTSRLKELGCVVHLVQPVFTKSGPVQTRRRLKKRSDVEVVRSYASAVGVKEPTVKAGVRLMRKA